MSSCYDIQVINYGPSAVEPAVIHHHRHPGVLAFFCLVPAHYAMFRSRYSAFWKFYKFL